MNQPTSKGFDKSSPVIKRKDSKHGSWFLQEYRTFEAAATTGETESASARSDRDTEARLRDVNRSSSVVVSNADAGFLGGRELPDVPSDEQRHWLEWLDSAVDPEVYAVNVKSLSGTVPYDYICYSQQISRLNTGRLRQRELERYRHLESGGWWCDGIDVLTFDNALWGCFKPNLPRLDGNRKVVKYEHPIQTPTEIFALRVPTRIWEMISRRYDVSLPEGYENSPHGDFWRWVVANPKIPIIINEGVKKAASLLSCGYVSIALPGIFNGFRQPKDEFGEPMGMPSLIPQLQVFAQPGRRIYFCFDQDIKRRTVRNVNQALAKTAKLFISQGCIPKVITWNPLFGKGVDDLIASYGQEQFDELYRNALDFNDWQTNQLKRLTYKVDFILNQRYLGEFLPPTDKQLICLKAPKGSGKSTWFQYITDLVIRSGERKVLAITHRVQLSTYLANLLGLPYITERGEGTHFGMGMCIDSLHPKSQAQFNPDEWKGAWLILDEVQQVIWHLLNSTTCQKERVAIIKTLKQLLLNIINHGGKIFLADADLNDTSIDFIRGLIGFDIEPWIVENEYKFQQPWNVYHFTDKDPSQLVKLLEERLDLGEKHLLCVSGQKAKSKWGSRNLEAYYLNKNPNLRILRIDSETVADPNHPAFGCVGNLNEIARDTEWWLHYTCPVNSCPIDQSITPETINESSQQLGLVEPKQATQQIYPHCQLNPEIKFRERRDYDLIIATPTIETGVSIEVPHFDGVWGIFQGVQTTDSVRQHLSRYRIPVPRYVWIREIGINRIGNGATTVKGLLAGEYKKDLANIKKLMEVGFEETIDGNFEPICINTWAKMGTLINLAMKDYAKQIIEDLASEGHIIHDVNDGKFEHSCITDLAKIEILINPGMGDYAKHTIDYLATEVNRIFDEDVDSLSNKNEEFIDYLPSESDSGRLKNEVSQTRDEEYLKYRESVAAAESTPTEKYEKLSRQQSKTEKERLEYHKGQLERLYEVPVTPDLIERDDSGWYSKIRLHYYFHHGTEQILSELEKNVNSKLNSREHLLSVLDKNGNSSAFKDVPEYSYLVDPGNPIISKKREYLFERDKNVMSNALKNGDGHYFLVDTNNKLISKKIDALDWLGFDRLLQQREFSEIHPFVTDIFNKCMEVNPKTGRQDNLYNIKLILGIDLKKEKSPMSLCQRLVGLIGYKFPYLRREGSRGDRIRIYGAAAPDFLREQSQECSKTRLLILTEDGQAIPVSDGREQVFAAWLARDAAAFEKAAAEKLAARQAAASATQADTSDHKLIQAENQWLQPGAIEEVAADLAQCEDSETLQLIRQTEIPDYVLKLAAKTLPASTQDKIRRWFLEQNQSMRFAS